MGKPNKKTEKRRKKGRRERLQNLKLLKRRLQQKQQKQKKKKPPPRKTRAATQGRDVEMLIHWWWGQVEENQDRRCSWKEGKVWRKPEGADPKPPKTRVTEGKGPTILYPGGWGWGLLIFEKKIISILKKNNLFTVDRKQIKWWVWWVGGWGEGGSFN